VLQSCDMNAIRLASRGPRFSAVNTYRNVAAAVTAAATVFSLAACSAGITSAPAATTAATASSTSGPSRSASAAASPASSGRILQVSGLSGGFPVPAGAKVAENISTSTEIGIMFAKVVPAKVASFYTQALPKAGYTVTSNSSFGGSVLIQFTGHGYTGEVTASAKATADTTLPGLGTKDITAIILQPKKK
jgi:hypothetical protein